MEPTRKIPRHFSFAYGPHLILTWCKRCGYVEYHTYFHGNRKIGFMIFKCAECLNPVQLFLVKNTWKRIW